MAESIEIMKKRIEVLQAALDFYADKKSHQNFKDSSGFMTNLVMRDRGDMARRALYIVNEHK